MSPGAFIVIEGPNGAGKSTLVAALAEHFRSEGRSVVLTREPGGGAFGEGMRSLLKSPDVQAGDFATALAFNAIRREHCDTVIRPAVERGDLVLCDRYYPSTEVFQIRLAKNIKHFEADVIYQIHRTMTEPDLTVFMLPDAETLAARIAASVEKDRFEGNLKELQAYVQCMNRMGGSGGRVAKLCPPVGADPASVTAAAIILIEPVLTMKCRHALA